VAFSSQSAGFLTGVLLTPQIFVKDTQSGELTLASATNAGERGDSNSTATAISADGRYVAFLSTATNLVTGDTNGVSDVFVRDRNSNQTFRVSVDSAGVEGNGPLGTISRPDISDDGRYVVFASDSSNLVPSDTGDLRDVFLRDRTSGTTRRLSRSSAGAIADRASTVAVISADGTVVGFDTNATNLVSDDYLGFFDVFVTAPVCLP
jgi:Tol biopolymer transport system component